MSGISDVIDWRLFEEFFMRKLSEDSELGALCQSFRFQGFNRLLLGDWMVMRMALNSDGKCLNHRVLRFPFFKRSLSDPSSHNISRLNSQLFRTSIQSSNTYFITAANQLKWISFNYANSIGNRIWKVSSSFKNPPKKISHTNIGFLSLLIVGILKQRRLCP